jgi:hypothetical protein
MDMAFRSELVSPLARRLKFFDTPPLAGLSWVNHLILLELTEFC